MSADITHASHPEGGASNVQASTLHLQCDHSEYVWVEVDEREVDEREGG